jgi:hypothetical protein
VKDKPFNFHGAKFTIKVLTSETDGSYTILDVIHPPDIGPFITYTSQRFRNLLHS